MWIHLKINPTFSLRCCLVSENPWLDTKSALRAFLVSAKQTCIVSNTEAWASDTICYLSWNKDSMVLVRSESGYSQSFWRSTYQQKTCIFFNKRSLLFTSIEKKCAWQNFTGLYGQQNNLRDVTWKICIYCFLPTISKPSQPTRSRI